MELSIVCPTPPITGRGTGWGDGRGLGNMKIQIPPPLGMSLNTISLSEMMELQFTSHKEEFKVPL